MSTTADQDTAPQDHPQNGEPQPTQSTAVMRQLPPDDGSTGSIEVFASHEKFRSAARMATALSQSTVVPKEYQGSIANCLVAMELAARTKASVLMVMQNLYIVSGKPGWSAAFLVASVNTSGRFSQIRYETEGGDDPTKKTFKCRAYAKDLATGDVLYGEWITWTIVEGEGWHSKSGSKWKTMPGQMFRYRAAAFWTRAYAPEISLGMQTAEEVADVVDFNAPSPGTVSLNEALAKETSRLRELSSGDVVDTSTGEVVKEVASRQPSDDEIRQEELEMVRSEESRKR